MQIESLLTTPGEHPFVFEGQAGQLEGICLTPSVINTSLVAILGHPHSLQGGTMSNKVVTTLARTFAEAGFPSIRFNFRGVGKSEGEYDAGIGESEDMDVLMKNIQTNFPDMQFILAGFSFGSYVAYRAALLHPPKLLLTIAPPVHHYDYSHQVKPSYPWIIFQGDADEVVPASKVIEFAKSHTPPIQVIDFPQTGHFFHGKLLILRDRVNQVLKETGMLS